MFKDLFVQLLQERDITAYKLAKDTNLSEALISNWKSGRQLPKYDSIKILCNYFNVSADYLLELIDASNVNTQHQSLTENEKEIIDEIQLIGVCTDICVISNAFTLRSFLPETPICVVASCCAGVTPQSHQTALDAMAGCQIDIL